jgi:hypothetical protein
LTKNKLTIRRDISVINPAHLSIFHSVEFEVKRGAGSFNQYSSKCFEVGGSAIMIELKFGREQQGISDVELSLYRAGLKKISRLQKIVRDRSNGADKIYGIFAIFNKNRHRQRKDNGAAASIWSKKTLKANLMNSEKNRCVRRKILPCKRDAAGHL